MKWHPVTSSPAVPFRRPNSACERTLSELARLGLASAGGNPQCVPPFSWSMIWRYRSCLPASPASIPSAAGHAAPRAVDLPGRAGGFRACPALSCSRTITSWEENSAFIRIITCHRRHGVLGRRTTAGPLARPRAHRALPGTPGVPIRIAAADARTPQAEVWRPALCRPGSRRLPPARHLRGGLRVRDQSPVVPQRPRQSARPHLRRRPPASASASRLLTSDETAAALAAYAAGHPRAWAALKQVFETILGARISDQETSLPMIAFELAGGSG
jgi:hypothetical protein